MIIYSKSHNGASRPKMWSDKQGGWSRILV